MIEVRFSVVGCKKVYCCKPTSMLYNLLLYTNKAVRKVSDKVVGTCYDENRDIVLITGGSGGLGRLLIMAFRDNNTTVVSLDIKNPQPQEQIQGVYYFECDVSKRGQVLNIYGTIKQEIGDVTVLINNAGITTGKSLLDTSWEEIDKIIQVNLLSSFYTIKCILPDMLKNKRGYIITIGSVLGYMSPAKLSVYGASKSGLVALHESLTYELGSPSWNLTGIKTLLVCPGQLQTSMFSSISTPSKLFAPELDPEYVASAVVDAIILGKRGEIKLPFYGKLVPIARALPWQVVELIRAISGIDKSMETFKSTASIIKSSASSIVIRSSVPDSGSSFQLST